MRWLAPLLLGLSAMTSVAEGQPPSADAAPPLDGGAPRDQVDGGEPRGDGSAGLPPAEPAPPPADALTPDPGEPARPLAAPLPPTPAAPTGEAGLEVPAPPPAREPVEERLPQRMAARPLVLPHLVGRLRFDTGGGVLDDDGFVSMGAGVSLGLADFVEVGFFGPSLRVAPLPAFHDPAIQGVFRLHRGVVEGGILAEVSFPVMEDSAVVTNIGWRSYVHASEAVRIEASLVFGALYTDPIRTQLRVPLGVTISPTPGFSLGATTGVDVASFDNVFIPVRVFVGGSTRRSTGAGWDFVATFALPSVTDGLQIWSAGLVVLGHFYA